MNDTEKTLNIIKSIIMDESIHKTDKDNANFKSLLASMKLKVKTSIAMSILNGKKEELPKLFDKYIGIIDRKIKELENSPYGINKSVNELVNEKYEYYQEKQRRQIEGYKEVLAFLKGLKTKAENPDYESLFSFLFYNEMRNDKELKTNLIDSLSYGYYDLFPFDGEYIKKDVKNENGEKETEVNFDYVDKVASILLDQNKMKQYTDFFEKKKEYSKLKYNLVNEQDKLVLSDWYDKHKEEVENIIQRENELNEQYVRNENFIKSDRNRNENLNKRVNDYRKNILSSMLHRDEIYDCVNLIERFSEKEEREVNDNKAIKEQKMLLKSEADQLLEVDDIQNKLSGEGFLKFAKAMGIVSSEPTTKVVEDELPEYVPFENQIPSLIEDADKSPDRIKALEDRIKTVIKEYESMYERFTPGMQNELGKHGWYLEKIIGIRNDKEKYNMTPYVSLCILKVLSDTRKLDPKEIFEYFTPEESYTEFSDEVTKSIERRLDNAYISKTSDIEKALSAKFRDNNVPPIDFNEEDVETLHM